MTDVGWTLLVDRAPTPEEEQLANTWREIATDVAATLIPGAKASTGRLAAERTMRDGEPMPWSKGLYVAHGIGLCGVESPLIGADFPPEIEEAMEITPGQVHLVEPYIHHEGIGGFRSEYAVHVNEDGPQLVNSIDVGCWPTDPRSRSEPTLA
jgi:Xaa-Pro aminopeptidase